MTDLQKTPQSLPNDGTQIQSLLVGISGKVDELSSRVSRVESTIDEKMRAVKTDLDGRITTEAADRRVMEAYHKAKFEMYDSQLRSVETTVSNAQARNDESFKEMRIMLRDNDTKTDKLAESVSALNTKIAVGVGVAIFLAELAVKILPDIVK